MKNKFIVSIFIFMMSVLFQNSYSQQDVNGWFWINGQPVGHTINKIQIIDAANMYAVAGRGIFMKSSDGGDTWIINNTVGSPDGSSASYAYRDLLNLWFMDANTGLAVGASQTVSSGVAAGLIKRTTDGGNTWTYYQYNDTAGTVNGIYFINSLTGYMTGGTRVRFFKTTDGGLTWQDQSFSPIVPSNTYNCVAAIDTSRIFLGTGSRKIYTHLPGQDSAWKTYFLPGAASNVTVTDIIFKDSNTGYLCGNPAYFAYTVNGGVTWTQGGSFGATVGQRDLVYDNGILYMGGSYSYIYKSVNDGVTWDSLLFYDNSNPNQPAPNSIFGVGAVGNDMAVVGTGGQVTTSNDAGSTWRNKNYDVGSATLYYSAVAKENNLSEGANSNYDVWVGANVGQVLFSSNNGTNWVSQQTTATIPLNSIDFVNSSVGFACGGTSLSGGAATMTTNKGANWSAVNVPNSTHILTAIDFLDANVGWIFGGLPFGSGITCAKTTDGGVSWTSQPNDAGFSSTISAGKMVDANLGYFLANSLYKTTNGGTMWVRNTNSFVTSTSWSHMWVLNKDVIYLCGAGTSNLKKIVRTTDGGNTWTDLTTPDVSTNSTSIFRTQWLNLYDGIICGASGYIAKTTDGGLTWSGSNPGGSTLVALVMPEKNLVFTGSDRNGAYQLFRRVYNLSSISMNVTMGIEGFWNGKPMVTDTVQVELHSTISPYALIDSAREVITINGYATYRFNNATTGSYYVVLKHRNSLQTWSANPVAVQSGGTYNYDFTSSASQAYGNNTILKAGYYCDYSGDVNQDGIIDLTDLELIDNDTYNFATGYIPTDVNGDGIADLSDAAITDNNVYNIITVAKPE